MSESEQRYYARTFEKVLDHLKDHPGDWTTWIAKKFLAGDKRKMREILQHLESEGKIVGKKNALNHYTWTVV